MPECAGAVLHHSRPVLLSTQPFIIKKREQSALSHAKTSLQLAGNHYRYPAQFQIVRVQTVQPDLKRNKIGDVVCSLYFTNRTVYDASTKQMAMQMKLF